MYFYKLYGNTVCSDLQFPQLVRMKARDDDDADIIIRAGIMGEDIKSRERECKYYIDDKRSWLVNSTTWLLVEDGRRVIYEPRANADLNYLRTYILGYAISMLYMQRGELAIHCGAVSRGGEAILIAGESGSGKSTVTDSLLEAGWKLMADDIAVVRINEAGQAMAAPGFPYRKLCRDVVVEKGYRPEDLIYINEDKDKFLVPYKGEFSLEEKPVKAMFLLAGDTAADKLSTEELKGINKFYACVDNLFLKRLLKEKRYEAGLGKKCLEIAAKIPIYLIRRPLGVNTLKEITEFIIICTGMEKK